MLVFGLKLHMVVIMKTLLLLYNIEYSTTHKALNEKELCVFKNAASSGPFVFLYNNTLVLITNIDHGGRQSHFQQVYDP